MHGLEPLLCDSVSRHGDSIPGCPLIVMSQGLVVHSVMQGTLRVEIICNIYFLKHKQDTRARTRLRDSMARTRT